MARVLVVDDDERIRRMVTDMLVANSYGVIVARDGAEAVGKAHVEKPDVILMDLFMPKMDGYAALDAIKKDPATRSIPVVMVTAVGHELNKKLAEGMGSSGYLTKPFTVKDLLGAVGRFAR